MTAPLTSLRRITSAQITDPLPPDIAELEGSTVGHIRKTPEVLSGIFTEVLRGMYSDDNGLSLMQKWRWAKTPAEGATNVWIDAEAVWVDATADFRPAIYVAVQPITYKSTIGRASSRVGMTLEEGEYHYSRTGTGTVKFVHVARSLGESQVLLSNTLDLLDAFSDPIRQDFCFKTLSVVQASPGKVTEKEPRERFRSELTMEFSFEDTWTLKLESPKLKRVTFQAGLRLAEVLGLELKIM